MTIEQFISKITENHTIEFHQYPVGYEFTVCRITMDSRIYRIRLIVNHDLLNDLTELHGISVWEEIYNQIVQKMSETMLKPYPVDSQQTSYQLVKYVRDFVREHEISCSEDIHQSDEMNLMAPEFMDKCCELIGYYEYEED